MKKSISAIGGLILAISMSGTAFAKPGNAPANSHAGGFPQYNWVVVNADGTVAREYGVLTPVEVDVNNNYSSGVHEVVFASDVSGCSYNATIDDTSTFGNSGANPGHITVVNDPQEPEDVEVFTWDSSENRANLGFDLSVVCK